MTYDGYVKLEQVSYARSLPLLVTTAPCMMFYGGNAKKWFETARYTTPNYGYGLNSSNVVMAMQAVEIAKQPSLILSLPRGVTVRPDLSQDGYCYVVNGPSVFPQRAMSGCLWGWKLWAVEFCGNKEIWLNFVNMASLSVESWRLLPGDGVERIPELSIMMPDEHRFVYHDYVGEAECVNEYDASEKTKLGHGGYDVWVRRFILKPDTQTYIVDERDNTFKVR